MSYYYAPEEIYEEPELEPCPIHAGHVEPCSECAREQDAAAVAEIAHQAAQRQSFYERMEAQAAANGCCDAHLWPLPCPQCETRALIERILRKGKAS